MHSFSSQCDFCNGQSKGKHQRLNFSSSCTEGVIVIISAGSSFPVVCLVSYPAAAAAAAGLDQGHSVLGHAHQTDLRRHTRGTYTYYLSKEIITHNLPNFIWVEVFQCKPGSVKQQQHEI